MEEQKQLTEREKEERRAVQLNILKDQRLKQFAVAFFGRNESKFGQVGKNSTYMDYANIMENPSKNVSQVISNSFFVAEQGEMYGGSVTPIELLKNATDFYFGGLDSVQVSDVLDLMGSKVSDEILSKAQKNMYMEDLKTSNKDAYKTIIASYQNTVATIGVGESIVRHGKAQAGNLEGILSQK